MADDDHFAILDDGVEAWNTLRRQRPSSPAGDLRGADLHDRDLDHVDFRAVDLTGAVLRGASLKHADLRDARLGQAHLHGANLTEADLSGAMLDGAVLADAHLEDARIHGGTARDADFRGVQAWRLSMGSWLPDYPTATDLTGANLNRAWLPAAQLQGSVLDGAQARDAVFDEASLADLKARRADFSRAQFDRAWLDDADLTGAALGHANLASARMRRTILSDADLRGAVLVDADLRGAVARSARLGDADLSGVDLREADLVGADLSAANLSLASLVGTSLKEGVLSRARIYGASAWSVDLEGAVQSDLVITPAGEPSITVDDLEVAQFVYLMLDNRKIRNVLDTVTSKTVLILGRFTTDRKAILDAIRDHLRHLDLVSVIFDFERSAERNLTETVTLLARMARFVIADLTDPSSIPQELHAIVGEINVPVQPIIQSTHQPYGLFADLLERESVLDVYRYDDARALLAALSERLLPALEEKRRAIAVRRARIYAELKEPS